MVQQPLFDTDYPTARPETYRELAEAARAAGCQRTAVRLTKAAELAEARIRRENDHE